MTMRQPDRLYLPLILILLLWPCMAWAQKKVTPIDNDPHKPEQPVLHYYDKHGNQLEEPVLFLSQLDTVTKVKSGPVYPLLDAVTVGVDFFDAIMKLAGQSYTSFSASGQLSLYNWLLPTVEIGVGQADNTPDANNYRYRCKTSPFFKIGFDYNFLYKSTPDYQAAIGLRLGWSNFRYDITDITITSGYWDQTNHFALPTQNASVLWAEALLGIKVKIAGPISMGWTFRYHRRLHTWAGAQSNPWFVPGYGGSSSIGATFSIFYTLPLSRHTTSSKLSDARALPELPETAPLPEVLKPIEPSQPSEEPNVTSEQ